MTGVHLVRGRDTFFPTEESRTGSYQHFSVHPNPILKESSGLEATTPPPLGRRWLVIPDTMDPTPWSVGVC